MRDLLHCAFNHDLIIWDTEDHRGMMSTNVETKSRTIATDTQHASSGVQLSWSRPRFGRTVSHASALNGSRLFSRPCDKKRSTAHYRNVLRGWRCIEDWTGVATIRSSIWAGGSLLSCGGCAYPTRGASCFMYGQI